MIQNSLNQLLTITAGIALAKQRKKMQQQRVLDSRNAFNRNIEAKRKAMNQQIRLTKAQTDLTKAQTKLEKAKGGKANDSR